MFTAARALRANGLRPFFKMMAPAAVNSPILMSSRRETCPCDKAAMISWRFLRAFSASRSRAFDSFVERYIPISGVQTKAWERLARREGRSWTREPHRRYSLIAHVSARRNAWPGDLGPPPQAPARLWKIVRCEVERCARSAKKPITRTRTRMRALKLTIARRGLQSSFPAIYRWCTLVSPARHGQLACRCGWRERQSRSRRRYRGLAGRRVRTTPQAPVRRRGPSGTYLRGPCTALYG